MNVGGSTLLRVVMSGGYYGGGGGAGGMDGMGGMDEAGITGIGFIDSAINWVLALPGWLSALVIAAVILCTAAVCGWIIGRIYISIRYPNPEKPQYLSPLQKIIVIVVAVAVVSMLMNSLLETNEPDMMVDGDGFEDTYVVDPNMSVPEGAIEPGEGEESPEGEMEPGEGEDNPEGEMEPSEGEEPVTDEGDDIPATDNNTNSGGNVQINPGSGGSGGVVALPMPRGSTSAAVAVG